MVGACQRPFQFRGHGSQVRFELAAHQFGLRLDIQPGQDQRHFIAEPADAVQRHLQRRRGWLAGNPADPDSVGAVVRQLDRVHPKSRIGIGVSGTGDLVEQLCGHGVGRHRTTGSRMFGDHRRAVRVDFGDGEPGMHQGRQIGKVTGEEGVVAAGGLGAALDDVSCGDGSGNGIVIVPAPAEVRCRGAHDDRCVGHPSGDDDVCA